MFSINANNILACLICVSVVSGKIIDCRGKSCNAEGSAKVDVPSSNIKVIMSPECIVILL